MCGKNSGYSMLLGFKLSRWAVLLSLTFAMSLKTFAEDAEKPGFHGETDLGSTLVSGNTRSESVTAKTRNKYRYESNVISMAARYLRTRNTDSETARYWDAEVRYARDISAWHAGYIGWKVESDPFAGYVQRDSSDLGLRSILTNEETLQWFVEVGFRHSRTHNVDADAYDNFLRFYTEATKGLTKTTTAKLWIEHLPNLKDDAAYLTNAEVSLTVVVSEIVSLKTSYLTKFQNAPPLNFEKADSTFITALVAKY